MWIGVKGMEYVVWIYKPLEESKINQLMGTLDLSVRPDEKTKAPKQPLSGTNAEVVLYGAALTWVHPSMEFQKIRRAKFLEEPILPQIDPVYPGRGGHYLGEEHEEVGLSLLHIKGRLYYAAHESYDILKLFQWAAEEPGDKDKGYRTVVFASLQDRKGTDGIPVHYRRVVLPRAFVVRYEERYDDQDGMGCFEAVFQQSVAELMDCEKQIAEAR